MNKGSIFVGGVHGSGKTQLCKKIQETIPCNYISASQLLQWNKKEKTVENVQENQKKLKEILLKNIRPNELNFIDGHFVLWNEQRSCEIVPLEFFQGLSLKGIILVTENANVIYNRLLERDKMNLALENIENISSAEELQAMWVAKNLEISLYKVVSTSELDVNLLIQQMGLI